MDRSSLNFTELQLKSRCLFRAQLLHLLFSHAITLSAVMCDRFAYLAEAIAVEHPVGKEGHPSILPSCSVSPGVYNRLRYGS